MEGEKRERGGSFGSGGVYWGAEGDETGGGWKASPKLTFSGE